MIGTNLSFLLFLLRLDRNWHLEDSRTCRTNRRKLTEDRETHRAHETNVDEFTMTETSGTIVNFHRRRQCKFRSQLRLGQKHPQEILEKSINVWNFQILSTCDVAALLEQHNWAVKCTNVEHNTLFLCGEEDIHVCHVLRRWIVAASYHENSWFEIGAGWKILFHLKIGP